MAQEKRTIEYYVEVENVTEGINPTVQDILNEYSNDTAKIEEIEKANDAINKECDIILEDFRVNINKELKPLGLHFISRAHDIVITRIGDEEPHRGIIYLYVDVTSKKIRLNNEIFYIKNTDFTIRNDNFIYSSLKVKHMLNSLKDKIREVYIELNKR